MPKLSAGLLVYRRGDEGLEVLLVHPGGPYWAKKDEGAWVPKSRKVSTGRTRIRSKSRCASSRRRRGSAPPDPAGAEWLGELRLPSGKVVSAWAVEGDVDVGDIQSNTFEMEWPPRSGRTQEFPEVDRASSFGVRGGSTEAPSRSGRIHRPAARAA